MPTAAIASALINGAYGIGTSALNNKYQAQREAQARAENYRYNEMAADAADARTRALYADFWEQYNSPKAQLNNLQAAGLSPSMMFSDGLGAGVGAAQGAQGEGANGIQPKSFGVPPLGLNATDIAQSEQMEAQARLLNAQADEIEGKNDMGRAKIAKTWAEAGAAEASAALNNSQKYWQDLTNGITEETREYTIGEAKWKCNKMEKDAEKAGYEAEQAYWSASNEHLEWQFNLDSYQSKLDLMANNAAKALAEISYLNTKKRLSEQEIANLKESIKWIGTEAQAHADSAKAYGDYVNAYVENLPRELQLKKDALNLEKWKIGVNAFTDVVRTIGYVVGAGSLGGVVNTATNAATKAADRINTKAIHANKARFKEDVQNIYDY